MRNETTRSAILNSPTPLALVCVLFLILMHIQRVDLHYTLLACCLLRRISSCFDRLDLCRAPVHLRSDDFLYFSNAVIKLFD